MKVCYLCVFERWRGCREQRLCDSGRDGSMLKHGSSIRFNTYRFVCRTKCGSAAWKKKKKTNENKNKTKNTGFNHSVCWTSPAAPQTSAEDTAAHKYSIYGYLARTFSLLHNTETTYTHKTTYVYLSWWLHSPLWRAGWPPITIRWHFTRLIINSPVLKQHREVTGGRWGGRNGDTGQPCWSHGARECRVPSIFFFCLFLKIVYHFQITDPLNNLAEVEQGFPPPPFSFFFPFWNIYWGTVMATLCSSQGGQLPTAPPPAARVCSEDPGCLPA